MNVTGALFYLFSAVLLFAGYRVITARSTVHSALYLVLAFATASALWLMLHAEFLAIALVLVYIGAVMVLFLFVVMMLDLEVGQLREQFWEHLPLALFIGALIALEMALVLLPGFHVTEPKPMAGGVAELGNTRVLGIQIYTQYLYPLQLAAVLLLVAIIAAIALTLRRRKDARYIDPARQVLAKKADRLRIVKMAPVRDVPSPQADGEPVAAPNPAPEGPKAKQESVSPADAKPVAAVAAPGPAVPPPPVAGPKN